MALTPETDDMLARSRVFQMRLVTNRVVSKRWMHVTTDLAACNGPLAVAITGLIP